MSRDQLAAAAEAEVARWERQLGDELLRLFDRQEAVTLARLQGTKARKHTRHWSPAGERKIDPRYVVDPGKWVKDAAAAVTPILRRLLGGVFGRVSSGLGGPEASPEVEQLIADVLEVRVDLIGRGVRGSVDEVQAYIDGEEAAGTAMVDIVAGVRSLYDARKPVWAGRIATVNVVGGINQAGLLAAVEAGASAKQWLSKRDEVVRATHRKADGQVRLLKEPFRLGGIAEHPVRSLLMFPGDPDAPLEEIINCRCTLLFSPARKDAGADLEVKARVRTQGGADAYGQPIGSVIVRDPFRVALPSSAAPARAPSAPAAYAQARRLPRIAGMTVESAGRDPAVRALIAKHNPTPPDPAQTRVLVARDPATGRVGAYVVWQSVDGGDVPRGTVREVSVHPRLKGQRIGDQLVAAAATVDHQVQPATRPAAAGGLGAPAVQQVPSSRPIAVAGQLPTVRSRAGAGDVPGTSGDFTVDAARIDRLQKAYLRDGQDTQSLFSKGGRWTRDRERQQQAVIDHFLGAPGVKKDRKILVVGGLPGAGKTTAINSAEGQAALGITLDEYVTVNCDEVKEQMVARGMVPDYPGLSAEESATMFHTESFEVAHSLMRQAAQGGKNFAYDTSLKTSGQLGFATAAGGRAAPPPFETTLLFVDVPTAVAKQRARDRYLAGGRYMPLGLIDGMRGRSASSSGPREQFDMVKGQVDRFVLMDNTGVEPAVADSGGRRARPVRGAAPARAAAPRVLPAAVPAAAATPPPVPSNPALPAAPAGATVYTHPQGKVVYVLPDGSMQVFKPDGKRGTSSATPDKLAAGYGGWSLAAAAPTAPAPVVASRSSAPAPAIVAAPTVQLQQSPDAPAPRSATTVVPMDFEEADLGDVPAAIKDPDIVFQQKVDGIRGVLVMEPGKAPWFASKKGERLVSSTAARTTTPILARLPATVPAGLPTVRVEGEVLNGKFHVFDLIVAGDEQLPYEKRQAMAEQWVQASGIPEAEPLPVARTSAQKQALWDAVLSSGAEGVMMKRRDSPYQGGRRVSHTRKAKVTATADVEVLAVGVGGKANVEVGLRIGGRTQSVGTVSTNGKGTFRTGDVIEVEYLWAMPTGTLTQPRIKRARPDKTPADVTDVSQLRVVDKTVLAVAQKRLLYLLGLERKEAGF